MMDLLVNFVVAYLIGLVLLRLVVQPFLTWRFERELGDAKEILAELEAETLIPLEVETHGNEFLCYNSMTKDFVCQGRDLTEIAERFRLRYPDKNAALHHGDEHAMTVLRQQLKEQREGSNSIRSTS